MVLWFNWLDSLLGTMRKFFLKNFKSIKPIFCPWSFPFWFLGLFGSSRVQYVVDPAVKIVFLNIDPSIVMTYDAAQNVHSVWTLRRVKPEVRDWSCSFSWQRANPQHLTFEISWVSLVKNKPFVSATCHLHASSRQFQTIYSLFWLFSYFSHSFDLRKRMLF